MLISAQDKKHVQKAIAAAERRTSGEFVAVVAEAADHYLFLPVLWAAMLALIVPGAVLAAAATLALVYVYAIQLAVFILAGTLFLWPPIKMRLVPRHIKHGRASHLARAQFYEQGVHMTHEHSGVLFFVSEAERYVEIVADKGIHKNVGEKRWQEIIDEFTRQIGAGHVAEGFCAAITAIGEAMATHYPCETDDVNELPNRLIEL
jgi:putative membrane protein